MKGFERRRIRGNPSGEVVALRRTRPVDRERLLLPGVQLALAGGFISVRREVV
jgi:hypothetical protein